MVYGRSDYALPYRVYEYTQRVAACQGGNYAKAQVAEVQGFGQRLREAIDATGASHKDFADDFGVRAATISDWVNEKNLPRADQLLRLCVKLNLSTDWLLTGTGPRERPASGVDSYEAAWREAAAELRALAESFDKRAGKAPGPDEEPGTGEPTGSPPGGGPSASGRDALDRHLRRRQSPGGTGTDG